MNFKKALRYLERYRRQLQNAPNRAASQAHYPLHTAAIDKAIQALEDCLYMNLKGDDY